MTDLGAVMWKEWRELRAQRREMGRWQTISATIFLVGFAGGMAGLAGLFIVKTPLILVGAFVPAIAVVASACEAFAGERERHTLETLLASRLTSEALLAGKIFVQVLYGFALSLAVVAVFVIGANARTVAEPWTLPAPAMLVAIFAVTPLLLFLMATAGALVSLRAPTVRQASSRLVMLLVLLMIVLTVSMKLLPALASPLALVIGVAMVLAIADVALFVLAWARFRRETLLTSV
jgi:ABC-2 type transport system permease protein